MCAQNEDVEGQMLNSTEPPYSYSAGKYITKSGIYSNCMGRKLSARGIGSKALGFSIRGGISQLSRLERFIALISDAGGSAREISIDLADVPMIRFSSSPVILLVDLVNCGGHKLENVLAALSLLRRRDPKIPICLVLPGSGSNSAFHDLGLSDYRFSRPVTDKQILSACDDIVENNLVWQAIIEF